MQADKALIQVLVVEDHQVTLDGLLAGLATEADLQVVGFAKTSDEGLMLAKQLNPTVILLDLHLPGSTGPRTSVQRFCQATDARVIILSAESRMPFVQAVLHVGAAGYLLKSESVSRIAAAIRQVVQEKKVVLSESLISADLKITRSEQEVLKMLARGMKYDEIAEHRQSSPATVRKQCEMLLDKLVLNSREQLIAWAVQNGYGTLELDA
jgi:two-component system nitrate/nitrite response regulator NarL